MFEKIPVPTPFQVGDVNSYVVGDTLVDPGPATDKAREALEEGLDGQDIQHVLITHPHPDHFGLACEFREKGAEIVGSRETTRIISDFQAQLEREQEFFEPFFVDNGMPEGEAETVVQLPEAFLNVAPDSNVDKVVEEGDAFEVNGTEMEVMEADGHAEGELVFSYEHEGTDYAVVGDQVLSNISPNPFLQPPLPESDSNERPRVLPSYNESLQRIRDAEFDVLLAGHRDKINQPRARINDILREHDERTAEVREIVSEPMTAFDVMCELFGDLPLTEYFPGMSEAVGHLDVLEERGEVEVWKDEDDGVILYSSSV
ncbi:MAG: MBL fold metallo-hydrolase [Halobacteria archaeon]|nr:MBL fold metallo-hydrolase [Halobacteria archaeon]